MPSGANIGLRGPGSFVELTQKQGGSGIRFTMMGDNELQNLRMSAKTIEFGGTSSSVSHIRDLDRKTLKASIEASHMQQMSDRNGAVSQQSGNGGRNTGDYINPVGQLGLSQVSSQSQ